MDKKPLKSASDLLARMQGGINWQLLENGIELDMDLSIFLSVKKASIDKRYLELEIGADKIGIKVLKMDELAGRVRIQLKFV